jgi:hypothetical protein
MPMPVSCYPESPSSARATQPAQPTAHLAKPRHRLFKFALSEPCIGIVVLVSLTNDAEEGDEGAGAEDDDEFPTSAIPRITAGSASEKENMV